MIYILSVLIAAFLVGVLIESSLAPVTRNAHELGPISVGGAHLFRMW